MSDPRILLVEDSDTQALQFQHLVGREGFAIERAASAEDALAILNARVPDLLVVDYRLPGMNGDELVRMVRQSAATRTLPILMLTGDAASEVERQGLDSGANAYVPKTGGTEIVVSRMRALLRQRRATATGTADTDGALRTARLLVVGADEADRMLLGDVIASAGCEAHFAQDWDTARASIDIQAPDCVIIGMAGAGGAPGAIGTLDAYRSEQAAAFEIIALAADARDDLVLEALQAGADDVLPRDGDLEMLAVRLRATVRRKLARDEEMRGAARERERALELDHARAQAETAAALAAANARLQETQAQLVQSAKMASLGELVAGIAHEINNPLAFILAHQSTVERAVEGARTAEGDDRDVRLAKATDRLGSMRTGLLRIQDLVIKLRRFSRLDDESTELDVPEAIDAVLALLAPKLSEISVERDYAAPPILTCSPALINQVVMNLVANAADAVSESTGAIRIATTLTKGQYRIAVGDNGPGIADAVAERVFEPFFTTKPVGAGTGLGLAIAYGIVQAQGGSIQIGKSAAGGAEFTIMIPVTPP